MRHRAFVSSTFVDLREHRAYVIKALRKAGFDVDPMEDWTSDRDEPKTFSQKRVEGCELCVLLVARRRGHVPQGENLSITQFEYRYALENRIDVLPFLLDDSEIWVSGWDERDRDPALNLFRAELQESHVCSSFNADPASLEIAPALTRWLSESQSDRALRIYLRNVATEFGWIRFLGLPQIKDNPDVVIDRLYVEPALSKTEISPDVDPGRWPATVDALREIKTHRRLVVLGNPGTGKSTLVGWLAWRMSRDKDPQGARAAGPKRDIPLPFILRDLSIDANVTWDRLLDRFLEQSFARPLTLASVRSLLDQGAMLLLDGFDEITNPAARRALRAAVHDGMRLHKSCRWLLTSRIVGYEEVALDERTIEADDDLVLQARGRVPTTPIVRRYVVPFDDVRIARFARNWFLVRESSEQRAQKGAAELLAAIRADRATTRLSRIPNLLTMMALVYRVRARLPNGRALLYNDIAQAYLETIEHFRRISTRPETLVEKKRWLASVAFEMQRNRRVSRGDAEEILATGGEVRAWVAEAMRQSGSILVEADAFVDYVARRSGLLCPRGEDRFAFLHLSFQEYFAAVFLKMHMTSPAWLRNQVDRLPAGTCQGDLQRLASDRVWHETLVFLAELLVAEQPEWFLQLTDCLFGEEFALLGANPDGSERAPLLARIVTDPHCLLDDGTRRHGVAACWTTVGQLPKTAVGQTLLAAEPEYRTMVMEILCSQAWDRRVQGLDFSGTPLSDLAPLRSVISLKKLNLSGTAISDLSSIGALENLQFLNISGCTAILQETLACLAALRGLTHLFLTDVPIIDLSPLASIASLEYLQLDGTGAVDLRPLGSLQKLESLSLRRTPVSDIQPLAPLSQLSHLHLPSSVDDTAIRKLRVVLPRCQTYKR